jgi:hypothetical protein
MKPIGLFAASLLLFAPPLTEQDAAQVGLDAMGQLARAEAEWRESREGLPNADDVARVRERMATGELSIGDAYDQVR